MLQVKEHTLILSSFIIFIFRIAFKSFKEFGGASLTTDVFVFSYARWSIWLHISTTVEWFSWFFLNEIKLIWQKNLLDSGLNGD